MRGLVWFKKDLRTFDNPALSAAIKNCDDGVLAVYLIDREMWHQHHTSQRQIDFILLGLNALKENLAKLNISLLIKSVSGTDIIPETLLEIADKFKLQALFFNQELEINEMRRDQMVTSKFDQAKKFVKPCNDQFIIIPELVKNGQNEFFKIFTPYKRSWLAQFQQQPIHLIKVSKAKQKIELPKNLSIETNVETTIDLSSWPPGEKVAQKRLQTFVNEKIYSYQRDRDYPNLAATSQLSAYLAIGMISVKACFLAAYEANGCELDTGNPGCLTWMSELIWREFYRYVLVGAPRVCMNRAYKPETEKLPWSTDANLLKSWQQGKTGFPLIDAAMRQMNTTGWMHNRLRMITAMFLAKNLLIDWRQGEMYFAKQLIDQDFASNNGGWQWCASTGTDAVPYFRLFNPFTQSMKFDANGDFIRQYCPELKNFPSRAIHNPYKYQPKLAEQSGYPPCIIDYAESRRRVIQAFKNLKK